MNDKLKQKTEEEISKLPEEVRKAIESVDWAHEIEVIGKNYSLNEVEIHNCQLETLLVLVGLETESSYASNIEREVGTSKSEAEGIAREVLMKVFEPIQNTIEENVKEALHQKNIDPKQDINFILSGGNYSVFIENRDHRDIEKTQKIVGTSNILETKDRLIN